MKATEVIPREQANRDVDEAIDHHLAEDAEQAAIGFIESLAQAYRHIGRQPGTGSSRYAQNSTCRACAPGR